MHQIHFRAKKGGAEMPICTYGVACTRPDCIYRHPEGRRSKAKPSSDANICAHFLQGQCTFGDKCRNRHVYGEEAERIRQRNANTPCRFGSACTTQGCLFRHPPKQPCAYGSKCQNKNCVFVHPDPEVEKALQEMHEAKMVAELSRPSDAIVFPKSEALRRKQEEEAAEAKEFLLEIDAKKHPNVRIPTDVFVESWRLNQAHYDQHSDPYNRLMAVNRTSPKGVIDLHFQTTDEVLTVLLNALNHKIPGFEWEFYDEEQKTLWIVTGAGKHTLQKGRALIFDIVYDYLDRNDYKFRIGRDENGNAGSFVVTLKQ